MASLSARTVFLKLHPSARTFAERREVLRVIERFGEVSMFKSNKYSPRTPIPNTFIVLFASADSAQSLINASPIRYRLISSSSTPSNPSPSPSTTQSPSPDPSQPLCSSPEETENPYQLHAYPSIHNHDQSLASPLLNPLHGPWAPLTPQKSYIAASLSKNTPSSIMTPGLLDWESEGRICRMGVDEFLSGEEGKIGGEGEGGREGNAEFYYQRRRKRRVEKGIPGVMGGLRGLREEFERVGRERVLDEEWESGGGFAKLGK